MSYKRKYRIGSRINSLDELSHQQLVYVSCWGDQLKNIAFIKYMQFRTVENLIGLGLYRAEKIEEDEVELQHVGYTDEQCGREK